MSWPTFLQGPLWWSLAALLPLIVVMYLLKLKRRRMVMPSTLLWRRAVQDLVANAPFQKLRNNLLLWLQLLLLALLILAFMRPVMKLADTGGSTLILLIDNSASMQTKETGRTRLDLAKEKAREAINNMGSRDDAIVIAFSDRTSIVQTLTSDKAALRAGLDSIETRDVETRLDEAGLILQGLTVTYTEDGVPVPRENSRTLLFSDGAIASTRSMSDIPNVEFVQVGTSDANLGITAVDVRESFGDTLEYQIFASVTNSGPEDLEAVVELEVDDEVIDIRTTDVPAGKTSGVVFSTGDMTGMATVRVDTKDNFPLDDAVQVRIAPRDELDILLVSSGNDFLQQVLAVDPRVRVSVVRSVDYDPQSEYDLVIFDGVPVGEILPGNYMFLNSVPPLPGFTAEGTIKNPIIIDWNRVHPLMRFVNFDSVLVGETMALKTPSATLPLVEAPEAPLICLYEAETMRVLVIGFDVYKSFWPLDVSFPIFMSNTIDYFIRASKGAAQPAYATGTTIPIYPTRESTKAVVKAPGDRTFEFSFDGIATAYMTETHKAGIYEVTYDSGEKLELPVNLVNEHESLIAPVDAVDLGGRQIEATDTAAERNREVWPYLALAALLLLMVEWLIYCRRTFM